MKKAITILAIATITCLAGCVESSHAELFHLEGPIDRVVVEVDTGDIDVRVGHGEGALVDVAMDCRTAVPPINVVIEDATLRVTMDAGNGASACDGSFEITIPELTDAYLRTGSGDVVVDGLAGDVEVTTFKGDIQGSNLSGDLDLYAVSGEIAAQDLESAKSVFTIGAGEMRASFAAVPDLVDVEVVAGNVMLNVPAASYAVEAGSANGEVEVSKVTERRAAISELLVAVTTGDIDIIGR